MPHINYLYDYTVTAFIIFDGKVLLVNHPRYSKWIPPGGHIELDEDPEQALFREVEEETGLMVTVLSERPEYDSPGTKPLLRPNYLDTHEANPPHRHISFVYFCQANNPNFVKSDEHSDMRWFTVDELSDKTYNLDPSVIFYATKAIESFQT
ncbi:MAG: NUDIX domain-containing protein [Candidatus Saccharimonadales bacterium]